MFLKKTPGPRTAILSDGSVLTLADLPDPVTRWVASRKAVVVDAVSLDLVRGSSVDYVENLGGAAFRVTNPNAASGCGCGSSFAV